MTQAHGAVWVLLTILMFGVVACGDDLGPGEPPLLLATAISAGDSHTCAILNDGRAACWGRGSDGALGNGDTRNAWVPRFVDAPGQFVKVSAGRDHTCGITAAGAALCWGANDHGQLGTGSTASTLTPVPVSGGLAFRDISAGTRFTCGVTTSREAYCWGANEDGQLGNGTTAMRHEPGAVVGDLPFDGVSAGERHACGLLADGTAYCWGSNDLAQLGEGHRIDGSLVPHRVNRSFRYEVVSAGSSHTCGVTTEGVAVCWGNNEYGALGLGWLGQGPGVGATEPVPTVGDWRYLTITAGAGFTCAVETTRLGHCWGRGEHGQLGSNAFPQMLVDVASARYVDLRLTLFDVSAGRTHTCGRTSRGHVFCWGTGEEGQLGSGERWSDVPRRVDRPVQ